MSAVCGGEYLPCGDVLLGAASVLVSGVAILVLGVMIAALLAGSRVQAWLDRRAEAKAVISEAEAITARHSPAEALNVIGEACDAIRWTR